MTNYHTHTYRCQHATGEDRDYVESAIQAGIKELGFSDHVAYIWPDGYVSGVRMAPEEVEGYITSIERLKREYQKEITIYTGFECEYYEEFFFQTLAFLKQYPFDYMILGQHHVDSEITGPYSGEATRKEATLSRYVDQVIKGMHTGEYLYVAHPDILHYIGDPDCYRYHMGRLCEEAYRLQMPLEYNLGGLRAKRHYPNDFFFEIAKEHNNQIVIGIDAHNPKNLLETKTCAKVRKMLESKGLSVLEKLPVSSYKNRK